MLCLPEGEVPRGPSAAHSAPLPPLAIASDLQRGHKYLDNPSLSVSIHDEGKAAVTQLPDGAELPKRQRSCLRPDPRSGTLHTPIVNRQAGNSVRAGLEPPHEPVGEEAGQEPGEVGGGSHDGNLPAACSARLAASWSSSGTAVQ